MKGIEVTALVIGALALGMAAGCAGQAGSSGFPEGERPKVEFFQLEVADHVHRATDPKDAVEAYLKITNRGDQPIELYKVQARLRGQIVAVTTTDLQSDPTIAPRPGYILVQQAIPPSDARIIRFKMTLTGLSTTTGNTGPLVPTLRGQLFFRTASGETTLSIEEQLTELDVSEEDED